MVGGATGIASIGAMPKPDGLVTGTTGTFSIGGKVYTIDPNGAPTMFGGSGG
jgi:hypothetical protein